MTVVLAGSVRKRPLCYTCALRMSIMHQVPPPTPLSRLNLNGSGTLGCEQINECDVPALDESYHPHFVVVYETLHSALRFFDLMEEEGSADIIKCRQGLSFLCCACLGIYQFLDFVYAPTVAAAVRTSPYSDSDLISVNVNVHRSIAFIWLAVAAAFYGVSGREGEQPKSSSVIPEEHCNFKEFFMSDLRARVLQYTIYSHTELSEKKAPIGYPIYMREIARRTKNSNTNVTQPQTSQAFTYSPDNEGLIVYVSLEHNRVKDLANGCVVPAQYCSNRCEGVLTYSVIYDYVQPYLEKIQWWVRNENDDGGSETNFIVEEAAMLLCTVQHANIMLIGNYRKMNRNITQSPWFIVGERIGSFSLQEIIANSILPFFFPEGITPDSCGTEERVLHGEKRRRHEGTLRNREHHDKNEGCLHRLSSQNVFGYKHYKFHSAGREDVDVRMLGDGRPFVLEVISPNRQLVTPKDLAALEDAVNKSEGGSVEISCLRLTDADITVRLAQHSRSKVKKYRCVVWCSRAITDPEHDEYFQAANAVRDLCIEQRTPLRVLHRRSLHVRLRTVHSIKLIPLNPHWFVVDLETQAGTYVKEFVHGDLGRTTPNLGVLLGGRADIIQLDVLGMSMGDL